MTDIVHTDPCVIGGGSGGLSVAAGAARMGVEVGLMEKTKTMYGIIRFLAGVARQLGFRPRRPVEIPFRIPASGR